MYSMTGFANYKRKCGNMVWDVKISTVNSKFLDLRIEGVRDLYLQDLIRGLVKNELGRGKVLLQLTYEIIGEDTSVLKMNDNIVNAYLKECRRVSDKFDLKGEIKLQDVVRYRDVWMIRDSEQVVETYDKDEIVNIISKVLEKLKKNRLEEGKKLKKQFKSYIKELGKNAELFASLKLDYEKYLKAKIEKKLKELNDLDEIQKCAAERELNIILLKGDFEEEIVRINSHLKQFDELLQADGVVGRKMGFLVQELNREFNTLGDKINLVKGKQIAIESKLIIDRIREQALNIE